MNSHTSFKLKHGYEYIKNGVVARGDYVVSPENITECNRRWQPADGLIGNKVCNGIIIGTGATRYWLACREIPALVAQEGCEFIKPGDFVKSGDFITDDKFWCPAAGLIGSEVGINGRIKPSTWFPLTKKWFACRPIPPQTKTVKITIEIDGQSKSFTVVI